MTSGINTIKYCKPKLYKHTSLAYNIEVNHLTRHLQ